MDPAKLGGAMQIMFTQKKEVSEQLYMLLTAKAQLEQIQLI